MGNSIIKTNCDEKSNETKQAFLASGIEDIASTVHLVDTKVSIIMAAVAAVLATMGSNLKLIIKLVSLIDVHSCFGLLFIVLEIVFAVCLICIFVSGVLTIRSHSSNLSYKSKWYLTEPKDKYSFDEYIMDIHKMNQQNIIENLSAELYKLNDINRQKQSTYKWVLRSFSLFLIVIVLIFIMLIVLGMRG